MPEFSTFSEFLASGLENSVTEVTISGVLYKQRNAAPLHSDFRHQDSGGDWWSPDYYVVVTAGQSNMVGGAGGAPQVLDPNVMMYDPVSGLVVPSFYGNTRNNLYLPYANELAQTLGRPVLVVQGAVSGSRIDSWLESGTGNNWNALDTSVQAALAQIGQDQVDNFLWLQGESDFPIKTDDFVALLTEFIAQVRSADWAGDAMAMLIGELSREGVHATQNAALQAMELAMRNDALLRFVSSTGLTSTDLNGVHFDGASLVEYGHRFFDELMAILSGTPDAGIANTAPQIDVQAAAPLSLVMYEGEELRLSPDLYFSDAEGDTLWLYGSHNRRSVYFLDNDDGDLVIRPRFDAAGTYTLKIYASDGEVDSAPVNIALTVLDAQPGAKVWDTKFTKEYFSAVDAEAAMAYTSKSRGIDILSDSAMPASHRLVVTQDNLWVRAGADVSGVLELAPTVARVTLVGDAQFDVRGNALANNIYGNEVTNRLRGYEGVDRLYGYGGNDVLHGGGEQDFLYGGDGDDLLNGNNGDDRLYGDAGSDRLDGGLGKNQYWGGEGADVFVFTDGETQCLIRDFSVAEDRVQVDDRAGIDDYADFMAAAAVLSFVTSTTFGVRFTLDGDQLQIFGVTLSQMTADQFLFA